MPKNSCSIHFLLLCIAFLGINNNHLVAQSENKKSTLIRYDGLYYTKISEVELPGKKIEIYNYLKFYDDGTVYSQSVSTYNPLSISKWFGKGAKFERKGNIVIKDSLISFKTSNEESQSIALEGPMTTNFTGKILSTNELLLEITFNDGGKKKRTFKFVQTRDTTKIQYVSVNKKILLPGQWSVLKHGKSQMYLQDKNSTVISLTIHKKEQLPFYKKNHSSYKTLLAYYNWELKYQRDEKGNLVKLIEKNKKEHNIIWSAASLEHDNQNIFLNGCSENLVYSILIFDEKLTEEAQVQLIKKIFLLNK